MTIISTFPQKKVKTKSFELKIYHKKKQTIIQMKLLNGLFNTQDIPTTVFFLQKLLPNIFTSQCFNDENNTFQEEVEETEIGHLFEHMLLEFLCDDKMKGGYKNVIFSGVTSWNWHKNPRGTFTIMIDAKAQDRFIFSSALKKAVSLLSLFFEENKRFSLALDKIYR